MHVKAFVFAKHHETPEAFEKRVNKYLETANDVVGMRVWENTYNSDVVFQLDHGDSKTVEQELCVMAWADLGMLESMTNNALMGITENKRKAKFVTLMTTQKSSRALSAFVVEGPVEYSGSEKSESGKDDERTEIAEAEKQNQDSNVKPKRGRKPKSVA
jgi:hypothetical protein